jgi:di/tricarboxylate transporter
MEIILVLSLLIIAIILFATEKLSVDVVTLILLIILTSSRILTPEEAFAGFSSDFIIILASIFVISGALQQTGFLDTVGSRLVKVASGNVNMLMVYIMIITGSISAFMNNTTVTALFIGPVMGLCKRLNLSPSKLLMPMAFASILGGTCTLIGTSTNVAVSGFMEKTGLEGVSLFELAPLGLIMFVVGIAYMTVFGRFLLPSAADGSLTDNYAIKEYLSEIVIVKDSPLIGQHVFTSHLAKMGIRILNIVRGKDNFLPDHQTVVLEDDMMLVECKIDDLIKAKDVNGILIKAEMLTDQDLESGSARLAEMLVTPQSSLISKTLKESDFRQRFGLVVLAMHRFDQTLRNKIGDIRIKTGDVLLVQGIPHKIDSVKAGQDLIVLGEFTPMLNKKKRSYSTVAAFVLAVLAGTAGLAPLSICFLSAAVFTVLIRAISPQQAYQSIDWRLLVLIGGMSAFGVAMEKTGAAAYMADIIIANLEPYGVIPIVAGFVILTVFLTQPMSNAAAALVVLPVALKTAMQLQANPRTFAIAIMLAASVSLITPFEPSCILVYGPGKYRFMDFFKTGSLLTFMLVIIIVLMVPVFWPL